MNKEKQYNVYSSIEGVDIELQSVLGYGPSDDPELDRATGRTADLLCPCIISLNEIVYIRPVVDDGDNIKSDQSAVSLRHGKDITLAINWKELHALKIDLLDKWRKGNL